MFEKAKPILGSIASVYGLEVTRTALTTWYVGANRGLAGIFFPNSYYYWSAISEKAHEAAQAQSKRIIWNPTAGDPLLAFYNIAGTTAACFLGNEILKYFIESDDLPTRTLVGTGMFSCFRFLSDFVQVDILKVRDGSYYNTPWGPEALINMIFRGLELGAVSYFVSSNHEQPELKLHIGEPLEGLASPDLQHQEA